MSDPITEISAQLSGLEKPHQHSLDVLRTDYSFLPREYEQFLTSVGWGEIADLMFYSGPLDLDDVFDEETAQASANIVLIGDDMAGFHLGYVEVDGKWMLTEFDHTDLPGCPSPVDQTLSEYVLSRLAEFSREN